MNCCEELLCHPVAVLYMMLALLAKPLQHSQDVRVEFVCCSIGISSFYFSIGSDSSSTITLFFLLILINVGLNDCDRSVNAPQQPDG